MILEPSRCFRATGSDLAVRIVPRCWAAFVCWQGPESYYSRHLTCPFSPRYLNHLITSPSHRWEESHADLQLLVPVKPRRLLRPHLHTPPPTLPDVPSPAAHDVSIREPVSRSRSTIARRPPFTASAPPVCPILKRAPPRSPPCIEHISLCSCSSQQVLGVKRTLRLHIRPWQAPPTGSTAGLRASSASQKHWRSHCWTSAHTE